MSGKDNDTTASSLLQLMVQGLPKVEAGLLCDFAALLTYINS